MIYAESSSVLGPVLQGTSCWAAAASWFFVFSSFCLVPWQVCARTRQGDWACDSLQDRCHHRVALELRMIFKLLTSCQINEKIICNRNCVQLKLPKILNSLVLYIKSSLRVLSPKVLAWCCPPLGATGQLSSLLSFTFYIYTPLTWEGFFVCLLSVFKTLLHEDISKFLRFCFFVFFSVIFQNVFIHLESTQVCAVKL